MIFAVVVAICLMLAVFTIADIVETSPSSKGIKVCQVKSCGKNLTEIESWECLGRELFKPTNDPIAEKYVEHDCGGVGWGNSIRGVYNAFALAAALNRRIIVRFKAMQKLWLPPYDLTKWDYGVDAVRASQWGASHPREQWDFMGHPSKDMWSFEKYGRSPNRWAKWLKGLARSSETANEYNKTIMTAGICGGEREIFTKGNCLTKACPLFGKCLKDSEAGGDGYISDQLFLVPFFYSLFSKPAPLLVKHLNEVRDRLDLPRLEPGFEHVPGTLGLQTPGYYILAMHFRRIPLGFEPLSVQVNDDRNMEWRLNILAAFWKHAKKAAKQAKKLAACRNQQLLIYFATDNIRDLRPEATKYLSKFGRVVFGLHDDEVGHVSPQWNQQAITEMQDKAIELFKKGKRAVGSSSAYRPPVSSTAVQVAPGGGAVVAVDGATEEDTEEPDLSELMVDVPTNERDVDRHGVMALVEWWILANANWLISHSGTSFSDTAAGWGLGPRGRMERLDIVHGEDSASTTFRRDWNKNVCVGVGAADPGHAKTCPNVRQ